MVIVIVITLHTLHTTFFHLTTATHITEQRFKLLRLVARQPPIPGKSIMRTRHLLFLAAIPLFQGYMQWVSS